MARIMISYARTGMRVSKDVYSTRGIKLLIVGTLLTSETLQLLRNHNVNQIDVNETGSGQETENSKFRMMMKNCPLFASFNGEQLDMLMEGASIEGRSAHSMIFQEKDVGVCFYMILEGSVKIYTSSNGGTEKILSILKSGDSFGELSLLDGKPRSASAEALEDTKLISVSRRSFMNVLQSNFELAQSIMVDIAKRISDTEQHIENLIFLDTRARVVSSLVQLTNRFGNRTNDRVEIRIALDFTELAQLAGVKTEEYQDIISDLEEKRIMTLYNNYLIINLSRLRQM